MAEIMHSERKITRCHGSGKWTAARHTAILENISLYSSSIFLTIDSAGGRKKTVLIMACKRTHPSPQPWIKVLWQNPFQPEIELIHFYKAFIVNNFLKLPCPCLYFTDTSTCILSNTQVKPSQHTQLHTGGEGVFW